MSMRISGAVLALALLPVGARAQTPVERRAAAAQDVAVRIQNLAGSVRVLGWVADSIAVTGTVPSARDFYFGVGGGGAKLGVAESGTEPAPATLEVRVPAGSTVWIKTASADVHVTGVTGSIDVYAVSGDIIIDGAPREVVAESLAGDVTLDVVARSVRAKSATGTVSIAGAITDATATTVSGPLTVHGAGLVRGRFESVEGDIAYRGDIGARSTLDFVNHAGAVHFDLPRSAAAEFVVNTYEGALRNLFDAGVRTSSSALKGRELRFRIGPPPGGQVTVRTFKGGVVVRPESR